MRFLQIGCADQLQGERGLAAAVSAGVEWVTERLMDAGKNKNYQDNALIYLGWDNANARQCMRLLSALKGRVPLVVIGAPDNAVLTAYAEHHPSIVRIFSEPRAVASCWNFFSIELPPLDVTVPIENDKTDWAIEFSSRLNNAKIEGAYPTGSNASLRWMLAKFFPGARSFALHAVGGGWSGAQLIRVTVAGPGAGEYYIKLFGKLADLEGEILTHQRAKVWLGNGTVELEQPKVSTPAGSICISEKDAWPHQGGVFPACFKSGDSNGGRITLKAMFADTRYSDDTLRAAAQRVLDTLAKNQNGATTQVNFIAEQLTHRFEMSRSRKLEVREHFDDLDRHGRELIKDWPDRVRELTNLLVDRQAPKWKTTLVETHVGHAHGDLNSRNILVSADNPGNILFIDNGTYKPDAFRVFDLAQFEADIKLLLLESDTPIGDLTPSSVEAWTKAEASFCAPGPDTLPEETPAHLKRGYALIHDIRTAAKPLLQADPHWVQYFACLLHWNLRWLRQPKIRRVKKVFAVYCASEVQRYLQKVCP